jgi:uncharacterized SAM-binding protein YcdF (DUF218 family)
VSDFIWFLFSTSGVAATLAPGGLWLWARPGSTLARRFVLAAALFYSAASLYIVPATLARPLTRGYHRLAASDVPSGVTAIVLLGAGGEAAVGWENKPLSILNLDGAARVLEASRVFRLIDPAWIISSGGANPDSRSEPSGIVMRDALVALGVPQARIKVETVSRTTHDEAVLIAPMLHALHVEHLVLVTSDIHMRRSLGAFRAEGWTAIPAIAPDPRGSRPSFERWHPTRQNLEFSGGVVHELIGIPYYRARGWYR